MTTSQSMTANTQNFTTNPIKDAVARIRELQSDLSPAQKAVRDLGRQRTAEAIASGAFSLAPRR